MMQPNSFLRPDHFRYKYRNIENKSTAVSKLNICQSKAIFPQISTVCLLEGLFFDENLTNLAPLISKTCMCIGYAQPHTHMLYIYTQSVGRGCTAERGSCCLRPSCPERSFRQREETLSGMSTRQRGGGRPTTRELHVHSMAGGRRQRSVSDRVGFKL